MRKCVMLSQRLNCLLRDSTHKILNTTSPYVNKVYIQQSLDFNDRAREFLRFSLPKISAKRTALALRAAGPTASLLLVRGQIRSMERERSHHASIIPAPE